MRRLATVLLVLTVAAPAFAGSNPDCQVCIDFSGTATSWDEVQSRVDPEPYALCTAYFCVYGINEFAVISFMCSVPYETAIGLNFTNLLPGDLSIGTWDAGITMASTECLTDRLIHVASLDLFYMGVPGDVLFLAHPNDGQIVGDCPDPLVEEDHYCVWMHGGVGKPALEGDEGCYPVVPVEDASWGAIKSLYR